MSSDRKRYRNKKRSCEMCKPHKRGREDARTLQEKKADEALSQEDILKHKFAQLSTD